MKTSESSLLAAKYNPLIGILLFCLFGTQSLAADVLQPEDIFRLKYATAAEISPDGKWIAYTVSVQRKVTDEPGGRYSELHVVSTETGESRPFVTGKIKVSAPQWSPDGNRIAYLAERGDDSHTQVWIVPVGGGESRLTTNSATDVLTYRWHPSGRQIAYTATTPKSEREKLLKEKGFGFTFYEENLKHRNLYLIDIEGQMGAGEAQQLTGNITVWTFGFSPDGKWIAASASLENLVDHRYVFNKIYLLHLKSGKLAEFSENKGKLGNFAFSPDNKHIAYAAALD